MADGYTDVCADGTLVTAVADPPSVVFGSDKPIDLPSFGMFLRARSGPFGHRAIVKSHIGGRALLVDRVSRVVTDLGQTYGNYCVNLQPNGTPVILVTPTTYTVGDVPRPVPPGPHIPPAQGFLCLDASGEPVWTDDQIAHPISWNGVGVAMASRPDGADWGIGQAREAYAFLAYHFPTATLYTAAPSGNSNIAPNITTQQDKSAIVARSLPIGFFPSVDFMPYVPPEPEPPQPEPEPPNPEPEPEPPLPQPGVKKMNYGALSKHVVLQGPETNPIYAPAGWSYPVEVVKHQDSKPDHPLVGARMKVGGQWKYFRVEEDGVCGFTRDSAGGGERFSFSGDALISESTAVPYVILFKQVLAELS